MFSPAFYQCSVCFPPQVGKGEYDGVFDCGRKIFGQYGIKGAYQGFSAVLLRNVPCFGAYFFCFEVRAFYPRLHSEFGSKALHYTFQKRERKCRTPSCARKREREEIASCFYRVLVCFRRARKGWEFDTNADGTTSLTYRYAHTSTTPSPSNCVILSLVTT